MRLNCTRVLRLFGTRCSCRGYKYLGYDLSFPKRRITELTWIDQVKRDDCPRTTPDWISFVIRFLVPGLTIFSNSVISFEDPITVEAIACKVLRGKTSRQNEWTNGTGIKPGLYLMKKLAETESMNEVLRWYNTLFLYQCITAIL